MGMFDRFNNFFKKPEKKPLPPVEQPKQLEPEIIKPQEIQASKEQELNEKRFRFESGSASIAKDRKKGSPEANERDNEDSEINDPKIGLFAVADGVGGSAEKQPDEEHSPAKVASELAIETLRNSLDFKDEGLSEEDIISEVESAFAMANDAVFDKLGGRGHTTLAAVKIFGNKAYIGNVGDSRVYRRRSGELELLTVDDNSFLMGSVDMVLDTLPEQQRLISLEKNPNLTSEQTQERLQLKQEMRKRKYELRKAHQKAFDLYDPTAEKPNDEMVEALKKINPNNLEQAFGVIRLAYKNRNYIAQAIGKAEKNDAFVTAFDIVEGDEFLVVSDGVGDNKDKEDINRQLANLEGSDPETIAKSIMTDAYASSTNPQNPKKKPDDITAVYARTASNQKGLENISKPAETAPSPENIEDQYLDNIGPEAQDYISKVLDAKDSEWRLRNNQMGNFVLKYLADPSHQSIPSLLESGLKITEERQALSHLKDLQDTYGVSMDDLKNIVAPYIAQELAKKDMESSAPISEAPKEVTKYNIDAPETATIPEIRQRLAVINTLREQPAYQEKIKQFLADKGNVNPPQDQLKAPSNVMDYIVSLPSETLNDQEREARAWYTREYLRRKIAMKAKLDRMNKAQLPPYTVEELNSEVRKEWANIVAKGATLESNGMRKEFEVFQKQVNNPSKETPKEPTPEPIKIAQEEAPAIEAGSLGLANTEQKKSFFERTKSYFKGFFEERKQKAEAERQQREIQRKREQVEPGSSHVLDIARNLSTELMRDIAQKGVLNKTIGDIIGELEEKSIINKESQNEAKRANNIWDFKTRYDNFRESIGWTNKRSRAMIIESSIEKLVQELRKSGKISEEKIGQATRSLRIELEGRLETLTTTANLEEGQSVKNLFNKEIIPLFRPFRDIDDLSDSLE